jgi:hypothetical protein
MWPSGVGELEDDGIGVRSKIPHCMTVAVLAKAAGPNMSTKEKGEFREQIVDEKWAYFG